MKAPARLLVRGVNWLGDAVMSMPALERLRAALPGTHISLLTSEKLAALWQGHPALDAVIPFHPQGGILPVRRALRAGQFDSALILPGSFRSALEPWLAGIPARIGYAAPLRTLFLTRAVPPRAEHVRMRKKSATEVQRLVTEFPARSRESFPPAGHHLHQYLRLASVLGASETPLAPSLPIALPESQAFDQKHSLARISPRIGLNAGAEYGPAKRWPIESFLDAAIKLHERLQPQFLLFGGPGDVAGAAQLESGLRAVGAAPLNLAARTTLRELAVGLSTCDVVLTNDTGPMHLAAAVGARVVVPFGSTSPELTGPGLPGDSRHQLLTGNAPCAPCFLRVCPIDFRCMHAISTARVVNAMLDLLSGSAGPSRGTTS